MRPSLFLAYVAASFLSLAALPSATARPRTAKPAASVRQVVSLPMVPADTALVLSIDVAASKRGPLFPRVLRLLELSEELARGLELLRVGADIDVRQNVTRVTVAIAEDFPTSQRLVYLLDGRFDASKLAAFAKRDPKAAAALVHKGTRYYRLGGKAEVALLGARLVVMARGQAPVMIDRHLAGGRAARAPKALQQATAAVNRKATLWAAFVLPAALRAKVKKELSGHAVISIGLSLTATTSVHLASRFQTQTKVAAAAVAAMIRSAVPRMAKRPEAKKLGLSGALTGAKVTHDRSAVEVSMKLGPAALMGLRALLTH